MNFFWIPFTGLSTLTLLLTLLFSSPSLAEEQENDLGDEIEFIEGSLEQTTAQSELDKDGEMESKEHTQKAEIKIRSNPELESEGKAVLTDTKLKTEIDEKGHLKSKTRTKSKTVKIKSNQDLQGLVEKFSNGQLTVTPKTPSLVLDPPIKEIPAVAFDPVPQSQRIILGERVRVAELLVRRYGRAYDYRNLTTRELKSILKNLDAATQTHKKRTQ
jgi:hypothetical protein